MQRITINSADWTIEAMRADWADDADLSATEVMALADAEYAYLINRTGESLRGWSYTGEGFTGPVRNDAVFEIGQLIAEAVDYVLQHSPEIRAEALAEGKA